MEVGETGVCNWRREDRERVAAVSKTERGNRDRLPSELNSGIVDRLGNQAAKQTPIDRDGESLIT